MQILHTHIADGVGIPAVHIDERLEAVLLAAVKHPIDRAFLIGLDMVGDEIVQEIIADDPTAGIALVAESICDEAHVFLQRIFAVNDPHEFHEPSDDIVPEILFIGDGDAVVVVG